MKQTVFTQIKEQLVVNELYDNDRVLQFKGKYPQQAIVWLVKNKVMKCVELNISKNGTYYLKYKDVDTSNDFLQVAYDIAKNKIEKKLRKGYLSNEPVSTKFLHLNDQFRQELECPNWSNKIDETGYAPCPYNDKEYERLSREDSQSFEHFVQWLGYDNYNDFLRYNEFGITENEDEIEQLYQQFLEGYNTPEYAY